MKGLIKNNYYKLISSLKLWLVLIILLGIATIVFDNKNTSLLMGFSYISIIGFSTSTLVGLSKNNSGKWNKYILTLPVERAEIVKSKFVTQAHVICVGIVFTGIVFITSILLHGFPFYKYTDIPMLLSVSIGISLLMSSIFFPISCIDTKDRIEVISIISLLVSVGIMMGIITALNILLEKPTDIQLTLISAGVILFSCICYFASYKFTSHRYLDKEF